MNCLLYLGENKAVGITLPDFKMYHKAIIIKTECYCGKRQMHRPQWNRMKNKEHGIKSTYV
jgi:hypothetical protein